jgi:hypothetical protein
MQEGSRPQKQAPQPEGGRWYQSWLTDSLIVSADEINALPEKLRRYIHDLETRCDPAGDIQQIGSLTEQRDALVTRVKELEAELRERGGEA